MGFIASVFWCFVLSLVGEPLGRLPASGYLFFFSSLKTKIDLLGLLVAHNGSSVLGVAGEYRFSFSFNVSVWTFFSPQRFWEKVVPLPPPFFGVE